MPADKKKRELRTKELVPKSVSQISPEDLNGLLSTLEVDVVALSECLVSSGYRLEMAGIDVPGLHYNLRGRGRMFLSNKTCVALKPHTLIIVPPDTPFSIETSRLPGSTLQSVDGRLQSKSSNEIRRFVAGESDPEILLICGFFKAFYGASIELFSALSSPIIEQFDETDRLEVTLKAALAELVEQEVGSGAMSSALLKQVIITIFRRSLTSVDAGVERFAMLNDSQIARSFAQMAANPGNHHTVDSLAEKACLSRSTFMARFRRLIGRSPMSILRELRMRQATKQLAANQLSIDQVARSSGYDSRSSFVRAFRKSYGCDPSEYRARTRLH